MGDHILGGEDAATGKVGLARVGRQLCWDEPARPCVPGGGDAVAGCAGGGLWSAGKDGRELVFFH